MWNIFRVLGRPKPWRRAARNTRGARVVTFKDADSKDYATQIQWSARVSGVPFNACMVPRFMVVRCWIPRPAKPKTTLPTAKAHGDVDNLGKAVMDALNGHLYADDGSIVGLLVMKTWATEQCPPSIEVGTVPVSSDVWESIMSDEIVACIKRLWMLQ